MRDIVAEIIKVEPQLMESCQTAASEAITAGKQCLSYTSSMVVSIKSTETFAAASWFAAQRFYVHALLSLIRLHRSQAAFNIRHGIENVVLAAYLIGNPGFDPTLNQESGELLESNAMRKIAHAWLNKECATESDTLKGIKDFLNDFFLHGSIFHTQHTFDYTQTETFKGMLYDNIPSHALVAMILELCRAVLVSGRLIAKAGMLHGGLELSATADAEHVVLWNRCRDLFDALPEAYGKQA